MVEFLGGNMLLKAHCDGDQMLSKDYVWRSKDSLHGTSDTVVHNNVLCMYFFCKSVIMINTG